MIAINIHYHSHAVCRICLHCSAWFEYVQILIFSSWAKPKPKNFTRGWNTKYLKCFGMNLFSSLQKYKYQAAHSHTSQSLGFRPAKSCKMVLISSFAQKKETQRLLSCFYSTDSNRQKMFFPKCSGSDKASVFALCQQHFHKTTKSYLAKYFKRRGIINNNINVYMYHS